MYPVRSWYLPVFCDKFVIEKHLNYKLLEDANKDNAYLLSNVNTVKFDCENEIDEKICTRKRLTRKC